MTIKTEGSVNLLRKQRSSSSTVRAVHEQDLEALIGPDARGEWLCDECGARGEGVAAAYRKRDTKLLPICFMCLVLGKGRFDGA
jgi:hypothetical protein